MSLENKPLSVGFVGLRHLHPRSYVPILNAVPGLNLVAVADADTAVADGFAKDFPVRKYYDWREMIERERLDLALLFLPHVECPEAAEACAAKGIHMIVEKPMAASAEGCRRIVDARAQGPRAALHPLCVALPSGGAADEEVRRRGRPRPHCGLRGPLRRGAPAALYRRQRGLDAGEGPQRRRPHV